MQTQSCQKRISRGSVYTLSAGSTIETKADLRNPTILETALGRKKRKKEIVAGQTAVEPTARRQEAGMEHAVEAEHSGAAVDGADNPPVWMSWSGCFIGCLLAYGLSFFFRAQEFVYWQSPGLKLDGQYLMSTHDAYAWLAGAVDVNGFFVGQPLPRMLSFLHALTGFSVAEIGFWLPAVLAPLAAIPVCLLACRLGGCEFSAVAGLLAATSLGYTVRTRLGSLDTDLYTLLFPVILAGGVLLWLDRYFDMAWRRRGMGRRSGQDGPLSLPDLPAIWGGAFALGLMCQLYYIFYASGMSIMLATLGLAGVAGFVLAVPGLRLTALCAACLSTAPLFFGWPGVLAAALLAVVAWKRPALLAEQRMLWGLAGVFVIAVVVFEGEIVRGMLSHVLTWLKPTHVSGGLGNASQSVEAALQLPGIRQSVREAQNAPLALIIEQIAGHWTIFWGGVAGYGYLCWRRPACLAFLPLLLLGLASTRFGYRFSMYGGPTLGLGFLGLGLAVGDLFKAPRALRWVAGLVFLAGVAYPMVIFSSQLRPAPVLTREYARTLNVAENATERNGWLWQWWDYGYAAQFYARRYTFADGGRNYSNWVFPLAKVHMAYSPMAASQLMHTFAAQTWKQVQAEGGDGEADRWTVPGIFELSLDPIEFLEDMGAGRAQQYLGDLSTKAMPVDTRHPSQYLVLAWDNLKLSGWISDFGSWNVATGSHARGQVGQVGGDVSIDTQTGTLVTGEYPPLKIKELAIVLSDTTQIRKWSNPTGLNVVMNRLSNEVFVMDDVIYDSMMVQMLVKDPKEFTPYFQLVVENSPWGRIYRLAQ